MNLLKIQFQCSSFCKLLWIQDFLERFAEEFLAGRSLITNFGLTLKAAQGKNLVVLWENLKTGQKHFHIKPVPKEISKAARKKLPLSKVFSDSSMQMLWKLFLSISICKGGGIQLLQSRASKLFCKFKSTSSTYLQLQQKTQLKLQISFQNCKAFNVC